VYFCSFIVSSFIYLLLPLVVEKNMERATPGFVSFFLFLQRAAPVVVLLCARF
jgi:hypothetical protein